LVSIKKTAVREKGDKDRIVGRELGAFAGSRGPEAEYEVFE
jgi:hypothetical protein